MIVFKNYFKGIKDLIIKEGNRILNAARKGKYISIPVVMDSTWKFITVKSKK